MQHNTRAPVKFFKRVRKWAFFPNESSWIDFATRHNKRNESNKFFRELSKPKTLWRVDLTHKSYIFFSIFSANFAFACASSKMRTQRNQARIFEKGQQKIRRCLKFLKKLYFSVILDISTVSIW